MGRYDKNKIPWYAAIFMFMHSQCVFVANCSFKGQRISLTLDIPQRGRTLSIIFDKIATSIARSPFVFIKNK